MVTQITRSNIPCGFIEDWMTKTVQVAHYCWKTYNASAASLRKYVRASIKTWSGFSKHVSNEVQETSSLLMAHMQLPVLNIEFYFHAILLYYYTKLCVSVVHNICNIGCLFLCFSMFNVLFYGISYLFHYCTFSASWTFRCFEKKKCLISPFFPFLTA
jgi:hypothetical protein